jgi:hypothetical protein
MGPRPSPPCPACSTFHRTATEAPGPDGPNTDPGRTHGPGTPCRTVESARSGRRGSHRPGVCGLRGNGGSDLLGRYVQIQRVVPRITRRDLVIRKAGADELDDLLVPSPGPTGHRLIRGARSGVARNGAATGLRASPGKVPGSLARAVFAHPILREPGEK